MFLISLFSWSQGGQKSDFGWVHVDRDDPSRSWMKTMSMSAGSGELLEHRLRDCSDYSLVSMCSCNIRKPRGSDSRIVGIEECSISVGGFSIRLLNRNWEKISAIVNYLLLVLDLKSGRFYESSIDVFTVAGEFPIDKKDGDRMIVFGFTASGAVWTKTWE